MPVSFFLVPINMELGCDSLFPPYLLCPCLLPNTFLQSPLNQACALKASLGVSDVGFGIWWVSSLGASAIWLVGFPELGRESELLLFNKSDHLGGKVPDASVLRLCQAGLLAA